VFKGAVDIKRLHQLYRHFDSKDNLLYIGISINAVNRLRGHQKASEWYKYIFKVTIQNYPSRAELEDAEIKAINDENPSHNVIRYNGAHTRFRGDGLELEEQEQLQKIIIQQCTVARQKMQMLFKQARSGNEESLNEVINIVTRSSNG